MKTVKSGTAIIVGQKRTAQKGEPMNDSINRQAAIDAVKRLSLGETDAVRLALRSCAYLERLPSAQPERLTDDDFETIRIHLNAFKEKLCNQQRWEEAKEY